ncbi:unnamed protein product [Victoria cruziana]
MKAATLSILLNGSFEDHLARNSYLGGISSNSLWQPDSFVGKVRHFSPPCWSQNDRLWVPSSSSLVSE